jgi:hypothetical protein
VVKNLLLHWRRRLLDLGFDGLGTAEHSSATLFLASAPALGKCSHRRFPRGFISVRRAFDVPIVAACPHPGAALGPNRIEAEDAADNNTVLQHVVVYRAIARTSARLSRA